MKDLKLFHSSCVAVSLDCCHSDVYKVWQNLVCVSNSAHFSTNYLIHFHSCMMSLCLSVYQLRLQGLAPAGFSHHLYFALFYSLLCTCWWFILNLNINTPLSLCTNFGVNWSAVNCCANTKICLGFSSKTNCSDQICSSGQECLQNIVTNVLLCTKKKTFNNGWCRKGQLIKQSYIRWLPLFKY